MYPRQAWFTLAQIVPRALVILLFVGGSFATGPVEKVVYSFQGPPDGISPQSGLVADAAGNLYGTTIGGGPNCNCGVVFELAPPTIPGGVWTENIIHNFGSVDGDSGGPVGTLIFDTKGNLYGTTFGSGSGDVFELSPPSTPGGSWTEKVLWPFDDPSLTFSKLAIDAAGNLYGTTQRGGTYGEGLVFELVAPANTGGDWRERILYEFKGTAGDGRWPAPDILLRGGVLYGTTTGGGNSDVGTVFQLVPKPGRWTETILYTFAGGSDGVGPNGRLVADSVGNFYGTTIGGGSSSAGESGCGTIYELSPPATGSVWHETVLHSFSKDDGENPVGALWRDKAGDLYGTASKGGKNGSKLGTVYKLKPPVVSGEDWSFIVLHDFRGALIGDGANPFSELILLNGAFYGTTSAGGETYKTKSGAVFTGGSVFSLVP